MMLLFKIDQLPGQKRKGIKLCIFFGEAFKKIQSNPVLARVLNFSLNMIRCI